MAKVKANKNLGQNFLIDQNIARKIVDAIDLSKLNVLEIGPGTGALTKLLIPKVGNLICIEIDKALASKLVEDFQTFKNVKIINDDILEVDLNNLFEGQKYVVISNLPYYISSKIIFDVARIENVSDAIYMLQKEVGEKIVAKSNSKLFGRISASVQSLYDVKKVTNVSSHAFMPRPAVDSVVVHLKRKQIDFDFIKLEPFIKMLFANRRKMIANNIDKDLHHFFDKETLLKRAEQFSVSEIVELFKKTI